MKTILIINSQKEEYGIERFKKILEENDQKTTKEILEKVTDSVYEFCGSEPQFDDMTMLDLRFLGGK